MRAEALDHVALWSTDRDALGELLVDACGMHEIERTDDFTLIGGDARRGKLTLFDAKGPRERGVLERVVVRVPDLGSARTRLAAAGVPTPSGAPDEPIPVDAPSGLPLLLVASADDGVADLDHVVLRVSDPTSAAHELEAMGLERVGDDLGVADKRVVLHGGGKREGDRPLLNHLALLVDDAGAVETEVRARGLDVDRVVDAENTRAVFVWGPDRMKLEYVEHKPGFSLV
jgi:catechol 2,3-dioxygenase-like lactoylglutathione lyase family enzyme